MIDVQGIRSGAKELWLFQLPRQVGCVPAVLRD